MDLISIIKAILPAEPIRSSVDFNRLNPGDRLLGQVLQVREDGKVMMDFKSFRALTEVPVNVQKGQSLSLEIVSVDTPLKMRIIQSSPPDAATAPRFSAAQKFSAAIPPEQLRQLDMDLKQLETLVTHGKTESSPTNQQTISGAVKGLASILSGLDLTTGDSKLAAEIQSKIDNSGLFFEKKLAEVSPQPSDGQTKGSSTGDIPSMPASIQSDFKANALITLAFLNSLDAENEQVDKAAKSRIQTALKEMLTDLGRQQETATKRFSGDDPVQIFHLALPLLEKKESARLKLYYAPKKRKGADSNAHPRISLLLDFDRLGPVRSDLVMVRQDLSITFYVNRREIKDFFDTRIESVAEALTPLFDSVSVSVRVSEKKIGAFDQTPQSESSDHRVDVYT